MSKVVSAKIIEKDIEVSDIPEGDHYGTWGAYVVIFEVGNTVYQLQTEDGIRTCDIPCVVCSHNGSVVVKTRYEHALENGVWLVN